MIEANLEMRKWSQVTGHYHSKKEKKNTCTPVTCYHTFNMSKRSQNNGGGKKKKQKTYHCAKVKLLCGVKNV